MIEKRILAANREPSHPGKILLEEFLEPLAVSAAEVARRLKLSPADVTRLHNGEIAVSLELAQRLSALTATSAMFWLNLQGAWDADRRTANRGERRARRGERVS